ncbi:hypothetical protein ACV22V_29885 [Burkholderia sp. AW33-5]
MGRFARNPSCGICPGIR